MNNEILESFAKLMEQEDGIKKAAYNKNPYQEDIKTIEEKRIKEDEDLIEQAHPDPVYVAESMGKGGLVENQNEQQKADIAIVNKMPMGVAVHRYASVAKELVVLANLCDESGELEAADLITNVAKGLIESSKLPFVPAPVK